MHSANCPVEVVIQFVRFSEMSLKRQLQLRNYKKAVLSQRWPRDARYISRSWTVSKIWPFEIIQDGSGRHLEFIRIENSAIRSAVPESHTLARTKHEVDRTTGYGDMAIWNFFKMAAAAILDLFELEIAPVDPSSPNTHPITKHEVDRTTGCWDITTWNFSNMAVAAILDLFVAPFDPPFPKTLPWNQTWSGSDHTLQTVSYTHLTLPTNREV